MLRIEQDLMDLLLELQNSGAAGLPCDEIGLAHHLSTSVSQIKPVQAKRIKEFAIECCYASERNGRLQLTKIGNIRITRLAPAMP